MDRIRSFLPLLVVIVLILCASFFFHHYWSDPAKVQIIASLFGFIAAAILLGVTWEYVRISNASLSLLQRQWEEQHVTVIRFGVKRARGKALLWVANLGKTDFLVTQMIVRLKDKSVMVLNQRRVVKSGTRESIALPEKLWVGVSLLSVFDVKVRYESQHASGLTEGKAFTLLIVGDGVSKVKRGIEDTWFVSCPTCGKSGGSMITQNLNSFDDADQRRRTMEDELRVTCPLHQSQWTDSIELIRTRREQNDKNIVED